MSRDHDLGIRPPATASKRTAPAARRPILRLIATVLALSIASTLATSGWAEEKRLRAPTHAPVRPADDQRSRPAANDTKPGADAATSDATLPVPGADSNLPRQSGPHPPIG